MNLENARNLFFEGLDLLAREDYAGAEGKLRAAERLAPERVSVLTNLSAALLRQDKVAESKRYAEKSVALDESNAEGWLNLGQCLRKEGDLAAALQCCERSVALKPDYVEAWSNRGGVLLDLQRYAEALADCDRAIALRPDHPQAWSNRGLALNALQRFDDALASYDRAIALNPQSAPAWANRGVTLGDLRRYDESLASYEKAVALKPVPYVLGDWLRARMQVCHWKGFAAAGERVLAGVDAGEKAATPFTLLAIDSSPAQQRRCAEIYVRDLFPAVSSKGLLASRAHERIRLGYFSCDFYNHATSYLMAELFERHERAKFELFAFSFGPSTKDAMRQRLEAAFEHFIDVRDRSDLEITALARDMEIDVAVDLKGLTGYSRPGIFALRAAPVQVSYMGYPGTTGTHYIDYLIADRIVVPPEDRPHYSEKIAWLPHTYWVNDSLRKISDQPVTREDTGLPSRGFVFCCFNNPAKFTPDRFDLWMRLLGNTQGSVLWLLDHNPGATKNLRAEAASRGIPPARLVFAQPMEPAEHLARHRLADLLVDTFHYNAHTTASDALWAGLPVITCPGASFASRVAASLLQAIGLPELITRSPQEYEALALSLASNPAGLSALKHKLARNRETHPLFDTALFARHMEAAYSAMWERHRAGLPPDHIQVSA